MSDASPSGLERITGGTHLVDVAAIDRELRQLWKQGPPGSETLTRACMSNLVIYCADQAEAEDVPRDIAEIVERHPSRVLLLVGESGPGDALEAYVSALCHLGDGGRQICSEHVTMAAHPKELHRLPTIVRSLLLGDLPTALWWIPHEPPSTRNEMFGALAPMANQVIYDSMGWPDPVAGAIAAADYLAGAGPKQFVSDLAWRRLKPLRRLVSQALDPKIAPGALDRIREVSIVHTPHALPQAWLLIGWLSRLLGWRASGGKVQPDVQVTWGFESDHGPIYVHVHRLKEGDPRIRELRIRWDGPDGGDSAVFERAEGRRLTFYYESSQEHRRYLALPPPERSEVVVGQLRKLFRDPIFADTLGLARQMAEALRR